MSVAQWNTHRCFRPPMSGPQRQKIGEHLGRLGLPYLTLCPYDPIATSLPSRLLWEGDGQTRRRGIPPDIQTTTHSLPLTGSIQGAAVGWVGVLLLEGDRVSVYCVEGHRFNLIMPEGPSLLLRRHIPQLKRVAANNRPPETKSIECRGSQRADSN